MRLRRNRSDVSEFPADMTCSGFELMGGFTVAARDNNSARLLWRFDLYHCGFDSFPGSSAKR